MPDYKVVVTTDLSVDETQSIVDEVFAEHGSSFDAILGHFVISAEAGKFTMVIVDVADGDIQTLIDDIESKRDGFAFRISIREGSGWFSHDLEED